MATITAEQALGKVILVTGPEEFLNERAVSTVRSAIRKFDPESEVTETLADSVTMGVLTELSAPSLFSSIRCVVVRKLEDLPEETGEGLVDYAQATVDDIALVLVHSGGQKGTGLLNKLRKLSSVREEKSEKLKESDLPGFVAAEARMHGSRISSDAAASLVQAVGADLRGLASAVHQLASDFPEQELTHQIVGDYFAGRAEVKSFKIAEDALAGRTEEALIELRWALETGTAAVLITGSFAAAVRSLAKFVGAARGLRDADLAREVGVPPWRIKGLRVQARGWDGLGLAAAINAVARADADVKGAAADVPYALERMVLAITSARGGR